ncbi:conserved hypothetical protein [Ricinus communis]|uniref:Secreted protein n=1 Tax=Ricinus communis TaxID=3988 RepID=B9TL59_RICCO|nr:conserved hypothetical protein [Ricinus communis]
MAAGRAGRDLLPILLVRTAAARLVDVEAVRPRRQVRQVGREHETALRFGDRHGADRFAGAVRAHERHRRLQVVGGVGARGCGQCACECDERFDGHTVSFQVGNVSRE